LATSSERCSARLSSRTGQERHRAVEIDRVAALDLVEDDAVHALVGLEGLLELDPALLAAGLVTADDGLAQRVLDALEIDLDLVADLDRRLATARPGEFLEGDPALGLRADVDDGDVLLDRDDPSLDDRAFLDFGLLEGFREHRGEIFARAILQSC
jgi:hypothetical protein